MNTTRTTWQSKIKMLGPGLLFAGAAVGVSHLVQSTRAGAEYGLGLLWVVLFIHLFKYPFFEFGPRYASSTGESLLRGYNKLGKWTMYVFFVVTLGSMFTVQAAVTIVTAGLAVGLFGLTSNTFLWVCIILTLCLLLLKRGQYSMLDRTMKVIILVLTISTLFAVIFALGKGNPHIEFAPTFPTEAVGITFLIALMGWMPAPIDLSVWHSLWAIEKQKATTEDFDLKSSLFDFRIGYLGTIILALCFLFLGALVMFGSGESFSPKGGVFAGQLIDLYSTSLGQWATPIITVAAFTTMFSTTLTCLDALPRTMAEATYILQHGHEGNDREQQTRLYWIWMAVLILGTLIILGWLVSSMKVMITIATVLSFLTAPFFAIANYKLVTSEHTPEAARPGAGLRALSYAGILFLLGFGFWYLRNTLG